MDSFITTVAILFDDKVDGQSQHRSKLKPVQTVSTHGYRWYKRIKAVNGTQNAMANFHLRGSVIELKLYTGKVASPARRRLRFWPQ